MLEAGRIMRLEEGTPQGGVISPLLANIYLHEVLDRWVADDVRSRLKEGMQCIRYADDFVLLFRREDDARRVMAVLGKRFERFGLTLHPEKTRILSFDSPGLGKERAQRGRSFDFLGFTHFWARSRKGRWVIKQRTAKDRFTRSLKHVKERCRAIRHWCLRDQHEALCRLVRGHFSYFGITGNGDRVYAFRHEVERHWGRSLARRNSRRFAWERFKATLTRWPLPARVPRSVCPSEPAT